MKPLKKDLMEASERIYSVGSLFAGIGGFCTAFKNAGYQILWSNECDPYAIKTYQKNFPEVRLLPQKIEELTVEGDHLEPVDVLTAGFPCQPFSVAGRKSGFKDPRGQLFFEIIRILLEFKDYRPKILVFENVKNLLYHDKGKTFARLMSEIQSAGYWFRSDNSQILNTRIHTPIPQNRERLFMVAMNWDIFPKHEFCFPEEEQGEHDQLESYLNYEIKADEDLYFPKDSKYGKLFVKKMAEGEADSVYHLRRYYVREIKGNCSPTLTANMGEGGHNVPVIQDEFGIRKLTPQECLRLQGFDEESFSFPEDLSKTQRYRQVGNAVTVPLVEKLAIECSKRLDELNGVNRKDF